MVRNRCRTTGTVRVRNAGGEPSDLRCGVLCLISAASSWNRGAAGINPKALAMLGSAGGFVFKAHSPASRTWRTAGESSPARRCARGVFLFPRKRAEMAPSVVHMAVWSVCVRVCVCLSGRARTRVRCVRVDRCSYLELCTRRCRAAWPSLMHACSSLIQSSSSPTDTHTRAFARWCLY